jgi:hypothetical protein
LGKVIANRRKVLNPPPDHPILKVFAALFLLLPAGGDAHAQALGSVHCKASLRQIEIDLKATDRKLQSVANGTAEEKCSAMNVHVFTLERAAVVYGRCTEGRARDENVGQAQGSAADARDQIAKTCG